MAKIDFPAGLNKNIAILAGSGRLPEILARKLAQNQHAPLILDMTGNLTRWASIAPAVHAPPTNPAHVLEMLKAHRIEAICMAGGMGARPRLTQISLDRIFFKYAIAIIRALWRGDDGLLSTVVRLFEKEGFQVLGSHEIAPELLASEGNISGTGPRNEDFSDIHAALIAARNLGARDIGQAAVVRRGKVIALETRSGTARMMADVSAKSGNSLEPAGVLAKVSKPGQELRVDMPAIGPDTVMQAHKAGLAGIVVEAGHSLLIDQEEIIRKADKLGLFVYGCKVPGHEQ